MEIKNPENRIKREKEFIELIKFKKAVIKKGLISEDDIKKEKAI